MSGLESNVGQGQVENGRIRWEREEDVGFRGD